MYITCTLSTAIPKLIANLIVSPATWTVYSQLCWPSWPQDQEASGSKQRLIVCVLSAAQCGHRNSDWHHNFRTVCYTLPSSGMFLSLDPWDPFAEICGSAYMRNCLVKVQVYSCLAFIWPNAGPLTGHPCFKNSVILCHRAGNVCVWFCCESAVTCWQLKEGCNLFCGAGRDGWLWPLGGVTGVAYNDCL